MRYVAVIGQIALFLAIIFVVGQATIIPIQEAMLDQEHHDVKDAQGDVILDGEAWMNDGQRLVFNYLPYILMIGVPAVAFLWYVRLTQMAGRRGPGGRF